MDTKEIIDAMRVEGSGNRGVFYENYGSGIRDTLSPLAELLEKSYEDHPQLVTDIAQSMYHGYRLR